VKVTVNEDAKSAFVIVPDNQLSLAIGKAGQNVRLAARLTGWRIDIRSEAQVHRAALMAIPSSLDDDDDEEAPVTIGSVSATKDINTIIIGSTLGNGNGHKPAEDDETSAQPEEPETETDSNNIEETGVK
jgi:transcription antitermination factor NusA-like protein